MSFEIEFEEVRGRRSSLVRIVACAVALVAVLCFWRFVM
jgi:hypothetical protein